ncbi:MAG: PqqD family peptide modification chaperone [Anaerolineae bacterium]|nr:PqqD family peptide modification chaperone [Anaerolineae bacterium]
MNETGKAIWDGLDGKKTLGEIAVALSEDYDAPRSEIEQDVLGLVQELVNRRMLVEVAAV